MQYLLLTIMTLYYGPNLKLLSGSISSGTSLSMSATHSPWSHKALDYLLLLLFVTSLQGPGWPQTADPPLPLQSRDYKSMSSCPAAIPIP